jgi:hypothetical protein
VHDLQIRPISLPCAGLEPLRTEAMAQGFRFLERLLAEWENGSRFDQRANALPEASRMTFLWRWAASAAILTWMRATLADCVISMC